MRRTLAARDVTSVYRHLVAAGVPQCVIAEATGQSQSEVSEILAGRRVLSYDVLVRVAEGFALPRGWMGLAYSPGCEPAPMVERGPASEQDDEEMKRRNLLRHGGMMVFGAAVFGQVESIEVVIEPTPQSSQLGMADVARVEAVTAKLRALDRQYGGMGILTAVNAQYQQGNHLMKAASNDDVRKRMAAALADHGNLTGWVANDVGLGAAARVHMYRAMDFAGFSGDRTVMAATLRHTGRIEAHRGDPNYALKFLQLGEMSEPPAALRATIKADQAKLYAQLGEHRFAREALRACEGAEADLRGVTGETRALLGDLNGAHADLTAASANRTASTARSAAIEACLLATIHVQAREPRGLALAREAIAAVAAIPGSIRTRERLQPLIAALEAYPSSDAHELVSMARKIAAVPAAGLPTVRT
jgi:transcriptional regulator with XRE-family HTH domain